MCDVIINPKCDFSWQQYGYPGSVTLFAINTSNQSITFSLEDPLDKASLHHFYFSPKVLNIVLLHQKLI